MANTDNCNQKRNIVLMFPGQGSQYINMGTYFFEKNSNYLEYVETASRFLGRDLQKIITDCNSMGGLLDDTRFSQIAIFCVSSAVNDFLMNDCMIDRSRIAAVAGHSLGDYSALYCSGAYNFIDGAKLVIFRGNLMGSYTGTVKSEELGAVRNETEIKSNEKMMMAAVLGSDLKTINSVLLNYAETVFIANYNDYSQIVISGYKDQVLKASEDIVSAGARRVVPLKVNIASHCPLMKGASSRLSSYIDENFNDFSGISDLNPCFFSSTRVRFIDSSEIKETLSDQLVSPVKWVDCVENLLADGMNVFIEVGPGKVLSGLVRRISQAAGYEKTSIFNTDSEMEIENLIGFLKSNKLTAF